MRVFKTKKKPVRKLCVAVVMKRPPALEKGFVKSLRQEGDWACFVAGHEEEAVRRAKNAMVRWGEPEYEIFVGRLTYRAVARSQYDLIPL